MNFRFPIGFLFAGLMFAQTAPAPAPPELPDLPPETVVATISGRKLTAGEMKQLIAALPPQMQQNFSLNRKEFMRQYAMILELRRLAEKSGLDKESPIKERLDYVRTQILMQAQIDKASSDVTILGDDTKKYYDTHQDQFTEAKIKVIYISYSSAAAAQMIATGKKVLNEAEAKAKAESLVKQLRAGADFAKLAKENSEDVTSAGKGGDFGIVKKSDALPDAVKNVIFALKPAQVSDPVKQPNGFYVFRADEMAVVPYAKVKDTIYTQLHDEAFRKWLESVQKSVEVKFDNEAFFAQPATAPRPPAPAAPAK